MATRVVAGPFVRSAFLDAVKVIRRPDKNLVVDCHRISECQAVQFVNTENFEGPAHLHNRCRPFFVYAIDLAIGEQRRRAVGSQLDAFSFVHDLPCQGFQAVESAIIPKYIDVRAISGGGRHVRAQIVCPQLVLAGNIAGTSGAKTNEGPSPRAGSEDISTNHER